ncbi:MAG: hypothetical protein IJ833_01310 [Lachnospiraceae bacterium]|nr:hypothetical protein [Lachnospiraceae bacterium]
MENEKQNKNNKVLIVLIVVIILLLIAVGVAVYVILSQGGRQDGMTTEDDSPTLGYDTSVILADEDTLQALVDEMKAEEGQMTLEMRTEAISTDGKTFYCYIANAVENSYDMFFILYEDETREELYRSGLIPLGGRIESFTINKELQPGTHIGTITYVQVEDNHEVEHARVNVGLQLVVN